ncbi:MAG: stage 0 sporulation protein, partial [Clostridia bacterium]|nr:stage 0 sporulation protein [Clostridia bacterium]
DTYEELLKLTPRQGAAVKTPAGNGTVEYVSLLKGLVKVKLENGNEQTLREFDVSDVKLLKRSKSNNLPEEDKAN